MCVEFGAEQLFELIVEDERCDLWYYDAVDRAGNL